ncbi:MAG: hypothetical protein J5983_00610 [Ruminococcus sp.]|nr:hypothetical protein [Ruminococcus sp.]
MNQITGYEESRERCTESGWYAYDYLLEKPMEKEDVVKLRPLGSFLFLSALKQPFFKVENDYYILKGIQGECHFRIAVHSEYEYKVKEIMDFFNK